MNRTPLTDWRSGGAAPILVLQGKEDITVPENADGLVAEFPDRATLIEIPDSGHAMLPEQPERIATAILAYLGRPLRQYNP